MKNAGSVRQPSVYRAIARGDPKGTQPVRLLASCGAKLDMAWQKAAHFGEDKVHQCGAPGAFWDRSHGILYQTFHPADGFGHSEAGDGAGACQGGVSTHRLADQLTSPTES